MRPAIADGCRCSPPISSESLCVSRTLRSADPLDAIFAAAPSLDAVDAMLRADIEWYLPTDLLVKMDIATMANSLEARSPFLDWQLTEFAAQLPSDFKVQGHHVEVHPQEGGRRSRARPRTCIGRSRDSRCRSGAWFRGELKDFLADHVLGARFAARGLFRPAAVQRLFDDHQRGAGDHAHQLWTLLMLELWFREFIDRAPAQTIAETRTA